MPLVKMVMNHQDIPGDRNRHKSAVSCVLADGGVTFIQESTMRFTSLLKTLVLIAAIVVPVLCASNSFAESGAHRGGSQPSGDVRTR